MKDKNIILLIFVYLFLTPFLLTSKIHGNDGIGYYVFLRSAFFDKDFDFSNEFQHYKDSYRIVGYSPCTGRPVNGLGIGSAILWFPFFLIAHLYCKVSNLFGNYYVIDGYSKPYVTAVCFGSSLYAFLGLILTYRIGKNYFSFKKIVPAILLFWTASPLIFYMYLHPSMAHANAFFTVTLFFYWLFKNAYKEQHSFKNWFIIGLCAGLAIVVHYLNSVLLAIVGLEWVRIFRKEKCFKLFSVNYILPFFLGLILLFIPQAIAWKAIFGSYFSGPQSHGIGSNLNLFQPKILEVLFSSRHGLISWHPIIIFSLIGIFFLKREKPKFALYFLITFALQLYIVSIWRWWWGAHSFGHRLFVNLFFFFILGLTKFLEAVKKYSHVLNLIIYFLLILLVIWNGFLIIQYATNMIDRDGKVTWKEIFYNQAVVVPRKLKEILMQFLKNRYSFFETKNL